MHAFDRQTDRQTDRQKGDDMHAQSHDKRRFMDTALITKL